MATTDYTLELLESYLQGNTFRDARRAWVEANCHVYADLVDGRGEYRHAHRKFYDRFCEDLDEVLQERLSQLGLTERDIEAKISDRLSSGSDVKTIASVLEEVPAFEEFAAEMAAEAKRKQRSRSLSVLWDLENVPLGCRSGNDVFATVAALKSVLCGRLGGWVSDPRTPLEIQVFHFPQDVPRMVQKALGRIAGLQLVSIGERKRERADHLLKSKIDHLVSTSVASLTTVVIVSSDNDFAPSLRLLKSSGFSTVLVHGGAASAQLREYADLAVAWGEVSRAAQQQASNGIDEATEDGDNEEEGKEAQPEGDASRGGGRRGGSRGGRSRKHGQDGAERRKVTVEMLGPECYTGRVERWRRSYGFVKPDDFSAVRAALSTKRGADVDLAALRPNIYVHNTAIVCNSFRKLFVGERVEFKLGEDSAGRFCALAVRGADGQPLQCETPKAEVANGGGA